MALRRCPRRRVAQRHFVRRNRRVLLRYETLERDLQAFAASLSVTLGPLPHAKRGLMSDTLDPLTLLRHDQIDLINTLYAEEFEAFGYPML